MEIEVLYVNIISPTAVRKRLSNLLASVAICRHLTRLPASRSESFMSLEIATGLGARYDWQRLVASRDLKNYEVGISV
jgi:hypothetical protein